jgi:hypothetical protein
MTVTLLWGRVLRFVAYYRVSTDRQGRSGLGLDAQQKAVQDYLNGGDWSLVAELTEVETGKRSDRPEQRMPIPPVPWLARAGRDRETDSSFHSSSSMSKQPWHAASREFAG